MTKEVQPPKDEEVKASKTEPAKQQVPAGVPTKPNEEIQKKLDEQAISMRRVRYLIINPVDFLMLFTKGLVLAKKMQVIEGVPADAKLISMTVDHVRGGIILVVTSDEYDEIPRTQMPPVQEVSIRIGVEGATKKKKPSRRK